MTDTITSADRKADLKTWIARLDQRIKVVKHDITGLQDELDNLEIECATSFDELDELEDEEDCTRNRT